MADLCLWILLSNCNTKLCNSFVRNIAKGTKVKCWVLSTNLVTGVTLYCTPQDTSVFHIACKLILHPAFCHTSLVTTDGKNVICLITYQTYTVLLLESGHLEMIMQIYHLYEMHLHINSHTCNCLNDKSHLHLIWTLCIMWFSQYICNTFYHTRSYTHHMHVWLIFIRLHYFHMWLSLYSELV
jgi:hypothetical protein